MTSERLFNSFIHPKNFYTPQNKFLATPLVSSRRRRRCVLGISHSVGQFVRSFVSSFRLHSGGSEFSSRKVTSPILHNIRVVAWMLFSMLQMSLDLGLTLGRSRSQFKVKSAVLTTEYNSNSSAVVV